MAQKPSPIQTATGEADAALHAVLKADNEISEAKAKIAQLDAESDNVLHLADSLEDRAALKVQTQAKVAVLYQILEDLEAQREQALTAFADAREKLDLAKAMKKSDRLADAAGEIAVHMAATKALMLEMRTIEREMNKGVQTPASAFKGFCEHMTSELFSGVIPGIAAALHPRKLDHASLANHHYGTMHISAIEMQKKLSRHITKTHWLTKKDSDPEAYAAGRDALSVKKPAA